MTRYWNEIDPKETRAIIQNDRDCFRTRAEADAALEAQGRFKRQNETQVVGAKSNPVYPAQPSGPWSQGDPGAPDPTTDQLGYGIDEVEPIVSTNPERADAATASLSHSPDAAVVAQGASVFVAPLDTRSQPSRKSSFRRF
jgi:hypothetical protein